MQDLVARWGTPLYVYSQNAIRERFRELDDALSPVPHLIAYSVKANGNLAVLRTLAALGAGADIVSGGELHRALLAGIPAERIVFSGVGKTVAELAAALDAGIYAFNVESEGELCALSELAKATGRRAPVALRVNPDIDARSHPNISTGLRSNKFGGAIEMRERAPAGSGTAELVYPNVPRAICTSVINGTQGLARQILIGATVVKPENGIVDLAALNTGCSTAAAADITWVVGRT